MIRSGYVDDSARKWINAADGEASSYEVMQGKPPRWNTLFTVKDVAAMKPEFDQSRAYRRLYQQMAVCLRLRDLPASETETGWRLYSRLFQETPLVFQHLPYVERSTKAVFGPVMRVAVARLARHVRMHGLETFL